MQEITTLSQLEKIVESSDVLWFYIYSCKNCHVSEVTKPIVEASQKTHGIHVYFVDVVLHKDLSDFISTYFQLKHEAPQIIKAQGKKVLSHTSHMHITQEWIAEHTA